MSAVEDVYDFLEAEELAGDGCKGWSLLRRKVMDAPAKDQLVVVAEDGGTPPEIAETAGIGDSALGDASVLITIRGNAWDSDATDAKATAILNALHGLRNTTIGSTLYVRVASMTTEPIFLGFDERGRPQHTVAFRMLRAVAVAS